MLTLRKGDWCSYPSALNFLGPYASLSICSQQCLSLLLIGVKQVELPQKKKTCARQLDIAPARKTQYSLK